MSNETTQSDTENDSLENLEKIIGNYVKGWLLPIGIVFAIINNLIVILVCFFGQEVKTQVSKQMRIYYIGLAIGDLSTSLPMHATYFLGKFLI